MIQSTCAVLYCTLCFTLYNVHANSLSNLTHFALLPDREVNANALHTPHEALLSREERHAPIPQPETDQSTQGSATTLAFIEVIVKRTVNQYMKVIRTQPDWFERLLQLVREELDIRSKYNCSTDACIYKIQLFTHYLHSHLMGNRARVRTRVRRSAEPPVAEAKDNAQLTQSVQAVPKLPSDERAQPADSRDEVVSVGEQSASTEPDQPTLPADPVQPIDDALRLPEVPSPSKSQNNSITREALIPVIENDSSRQQASHFGTPDKINMVRVSQEVLSEALSKQQRVPPNLTPSDETSETKADALPFENSMPAVDESDLISSVEPQEESSVHESGPAMDDLDTNSILTVEEEMSHVQPQEPIATTLTATSEPTSSTAVSAADARSAAAVAAAAATTTSVKETTETNQLLQNPSVNSFDSSPVISRPEDRSQPDQSWNNAVESDENPRLHLDLSVHAIPFGQNEFVGKPYENCTGRFENYCYNALKCVYISVLETAACYCRTGYTGVRCDMFNLPQTLDILKSFKEDLIDLPSLHQTNTVTLYSVVEATARYTVNAVLEENLISAWEEDSIL